MIRLDVRGTVASGSFHSSSEQAGWTGHGITRIVHGELAHTGHTDLWYRASGSYHTFGIHFSTVKSREMCTHPTRPAYLPS